MIPVGVSSQAAGPGSGANLAWFEWWPMGFPMLDQVDHCAIGDCPGLIFAYRFRDGRAELLESCDIAAALHEPGGWIWIHLALTDEASRTWIERAAPIPPRARAILLSDDDHLLLEPVEDGVAG